MLGAQQNRAVNLSILASPHEVIVIPVTCVEAARRRPAVGPLQCRAPCHVCGRARRPHQPSHRSMRATGTRCSDQSAVWSEIAGAARFWGMVTFPVTPLDALCDEGNTRTSLRRRRPARVRTHAGRRSHRSRSGPKPVGNRIPCSRALADCFARTCSDPAGVIFFTLAFGILSAPTRLPIDGRELSKSTRTHRNA